MRLLYLMTEPFGFGGVQTDILTLSRELIKKGYDIFVATTPGVRLDELKSNGTHHLDINFHYRGFSGLYRAVKALRQAIREHQIELLAPQSVRSTLVAFIATRLLPFSYRVGSTGKRIPIVTTIHNIHSPIHFYYAGHLLQRCADYVIFESHYERNRLLASGLSADKSSVIHSGIDTDKFAPQPPNQELAQRYTLQLGQHKVLGIVARLSEEKGHNYLVEAFAMLHRDISEARLLVIGDGPLLETVKAQVAQLGLNEVVIFAGAQRNIAEHLALLDVFVLASTRESFPLAAREAMAAARAVIAPRIGGCPEVVDDGVTGYLFESRDSQQLYQRMKKLLEADQFRAFGVAARQRVERLFSQRSWLEGDDEIYQQFHRVKSPSA